MEQIRTNEVQHRNCILTQSLEYHCGNILSIIDPEIGDIISDYPKCYFHVDATQSIGKVNINFEDVDLVSFSAHKIYGLKGIGCLIKKENIISAKLYSSEI